MKCPYCGKEMSEGYIYNGQQPNQWLPKGVMPARIKFTKRAEGVDLKNTFHFFKESGYCSEAFHCYGCQIVIAPTE
jgi:hypothetical protein